MVFDKLKIILLDALILIYFDYNREIKLETNILNKIYVGIIN